MVPKSYQDLEEVTVTIHPPGVVPYLDQFQATTKSIPMGKHLKIGVEALVTNVTEGFASLDPEDRQCKLNLDESHPYSDINCRMQKNLDVAIHIEARLGVIHFLRVLQGAGPVAVSRAGGD